MNQAQVILMKFFRILSTLPLLIFTLSACSLKPYHIPIDQGHALSAKEISQIKPGMSKDQIQYLLGTPNLVDPFHPEIWNYIHTSKKNHQAMSNYQLVLFFKDDKLSKIEGNYASPSALEYTSFQDESSSKNQD